MSQIKTIKRLVDIKKSAAEDAEAAHALALNAVTAADERKARAETAWASALDATLANVASSSDLDIRDKHVRSLRRVIEACERECFTARREEAAKRAAMTDARIELRRFEKWLEKTMDARSAEVRRVERLAEDEVAARRSAEPEREERKPSSRGAA